MTKKEEILSIIDAMLTKNKLENKKMTYALTLNFIKVIDPYSETKFDKSAKATVQKHLEEIGEVNTYNLAFEIGKWGAHSFGNKIVFYNGSIHIDINGSFASFSYQLTNFVKDTKFTKDNLDSKIDKSLKLMKSFKNFNDNISKSLDEF